MTTTASVSKRSRRCKNRYRNVARSLVAPNPGMVSKIGGKTGIPCVPGNVGRPRGGPNDWGIGAPTRASTGPSERPRGDVEPGRLPSASRARPHYASSQAKSQTTSYLFLSLSLSFVSHPKFRVPLEISSRARSSYLIGSLPFAFFCFVMPGRRRGNGEQ
jgi:hypothetical protein